MLTRRIPSMLQTKLNTEVDALKVKAEERRVAREAAEASMEAEPREGAEVAPVGA
jgi:hypothetical protein